MRGIEKGYPPHYAHSPCRLFHRRNSRSVYSWKDTSGIFRRWLPEAITNHFQDNEGLAFPFLK